MRMKIKELYKPTREISADEAMVAFNGQLHFKQYQLSKPSKYVIKIWRAAEAKSRYLLNFVVYTGKKDDVGKGLGHHAVMTVGLDYLMKILDDLMGTCSSNIFITGSMLLKRIKICQEHSH